MDRRTYRYLESPLRVGPLTIRQWVYVIVACAGVYGLIAGVGAPIRTTLTLAAFVIGLPAALAAVSDDLDYSLSGRFSDVLRWRFGARFFTQDAALPVVNLRVDEKPVANVDGNSEKHPAALSDVFMITRDGLLVRRDGVFVRAIEVGSINPLVVDDDEATKISERLAAVAQRLDAGEQLQFFVDARPVPLDSVIDESRAATAAAVRDAVAAGSSKRAEALSRLQTASEQSITTHSAGIAAMQLRYFVLVPYNPVEISLRRAIADSRSPSLTSRDVVRGVATSAALVDGVIKDLEVIERETRVLDGYAFATLIGESVSGSAFSSSELVDVFEDLDDVAAVLDAATNSATRDRLLRALFQGNYDFSDFRTARIGEDLVQTIYMSDIPEATWLGQPLQLMQIGQPFTYSVFVKATDRVRERRNYRNRFRRIRGINIGKERRQRHVSVEAEFQEAEAEAVVADLSTTLGSGIFEVSTYISVRGRAGRDEEDLREAVKGIRREATLSCDARFAEGLFAQRGLFTSRTPIALDAAERSKRFVSRNVGDLLPLVGSSCGSPSGIVAGYSAPGRTLERIDPYDPVHENHLVLLSGKSGSGKSMFANVMLSRWLSRGARGFIIDRAGHYDFLCSLIPDAAHVPIGPGADGFRVNPWDVSDPAHVSSEKVSFLVDLHSLLIGEIGGDGERFLSAIEIAVLERAIRDVYSAAARSDVVATESTLQRILFERAGEGDDVIAPTALSLAHRLDQFVGDGSFAYLTDRPSNVPIDAPLVSFDTRATPEYMAGAVMLLITEHIVRHVAEWRADYLAGDVGYAEWSGRAFLVIDEAWSQMLTRTTGRHINEYARRSRHMGLTFVAISQHLSDFSGEYGEAFRMNSTIQIYFRQSADDLTYASASSQFSDAMVDMLGKLRTSKRDFATAFVINGTRGSGAITIRYGDLEYWLATSDPIGDEPVRRAALRSAGGDPYGALRLLADRAWHSEFAAQRVAPV